MGYSNGTRWTDELIKEKVLEVKNALSIDRMPSRKECEEYFHDTKLTNAITKRTRWYKLANDLGLQIKDSETYFGKKQEAIAEEILLGKGFSVRRMSQNFPYDLLVDDCVKIDVKASHLYRGKMGSFYTFNLEKQFAVCDIYILFALDDDDENRRTFVIPSKFVVSQNQISIGEITSKYNRFIDKWEYIEDAVNYWESVS